MKRATQAAQVLPMLAHESVYIGIDVGKFQHVAGFDIRSRDHLVSFITMLSIVG